MAQHNPGSVPLGDAVTVAVQNAHHGLLRLSQMLSNPQQPLNDQQRRRAIAEYLQHAQGLLLGDVSAATVFVSPDGQQVKLGSFAQVSALNAQGRLARDAAVGEDGNNAAADGLLGVPGYAPPEAKRAHDIGRNGGSDAGWHLPETAAQEALVSSVEVLVRQQKVPTNARARGGK